MRSLKRLKVNKIYLSIFFMIIIIISLCFTNSIKVNAQINESKIYTNAIIDEDFDNSCVLVVLKSSFSKYNDIDSTIVNKIMQENNVLSVENISEFSEDIVNNDGTLNDKINSEIVEHLSNIEFKQVLKVNLNEKSKDNVLDLIKIIEQYDEVICAEPNYYFSPEAIPDDTMISNQWNLIGDNGIDMTKSWDFAVGTRDIRVGILDTGIINHNDLNDNLTAGYDFYNNNSTTTDDSYGHGTSVAGIIGAVGNNTQGVTGINQRVTIVPMQVSYIKESKTYIDTLAVKQAIQYASNLWDTENRISILNYSVSGYGSTTFLLATIETFPGLFVWSAGNKGENVDNFKNISMFNLTNLISVGAHDKYNGRSIWDSTQSSSYGSAVDIYAPGGKGLGDNSDNCYTTSASSSSSYRYFNGTSCAAPHVAGVAALLLSLNEELTAIQLRQAILESAEEITITVPDTTEDAEEGDTVEQDVLKLNAYNAVKYVLENYMNPTTYTLSNYSSTINTNKAITSDASYFNELNGFYKLNVTYAKSYEFISSSTSGIEVTLYGEDFTEIPFNDLDSTSNKVRFIESLNTGIYYLRVSYVNEDNSGTISTSIQEPCSGCNSLYRDKVALNCQTEPYEDSLYLQQNQTIIYELDLECDTRYDFEVESPNLLSVGLYDENMTLVSEFLYIQGTNNNYYYFNVQDLEEGRYHIKVNLASGSSSCNINVTLDHRPTSPEEILVNEPVDVLEHLHYSSNAYYFMRNKPGIYEVVLTGISSNGTIIYPEGTITIVSGDNVVQKYVFTEEDYDNPATSLNGSNIMTWLVDDYANYYIIIEISSTGLTSLQLEVRELETFTLSASDEFSEISQLVNGDKFEILDVERTGEYNVQATYTGSQTDDMLFVILRKNSDGLFEEVDGGLFNNTTNFETDVLLNTGEQIYIGYFNGNGNGTFSLNIERNVSNTFSLMTDPNGNVTVGSEVSLNNGEYGGTTLTQGYTRIVYLGIDAPYIQSRTQYNWYTTDSSVAIVSAYGTVTATATWTGSQTSKTVVIRAVYKSNPTIVGEITLTVYKETNTAIEVLTQYGMDVRGDGSQGTEVTVLHESPINIGVMPDVEIHKGYTRYICLGSDSPSNIIQHFTWSIDRQDGEIGNATVSQYGVIKGTTEGYITIKGVYKYNPRYVIYITVKVL